MNEPERWPEHSGDDGRIDGGFLIWPVLLIVVGIILYLTRWL